MPFLEANDLLSFHSTLKSERGLYDEVFQDIADFMKGRGEFNVKETGGRDRTVELYDTTCLQSGDLLASGLDNFITNQATTWFQPRPEDRTLLEVEGSPEWHDAVHERMNAAYNRSESGFAQAKHEFWIDLVFWNTACMFVDDALGGPRFQAIPLQEVYVAEGPDGRINVISREYELTHRQAVAKFGDNVGGKILQEADKNPNGTSTYVNIVHEREDPLVKNPNQLPSDLPIRSVVVNTETKLKVSEGGYHEMPYMVARFEKEAGHIYGIGPGRNAIADARMLNAMAKALIKATNKMVDPPLLANDNSVVFPIRTEAGGITTVRGGGFKGQEPLTTLPIDGRIPLTFDFYTARQTSAKTHFMHDLLQLFQTNIRTAAQVDEVTREAQRLLSPVIGRLQPEFLDPMHERVFGVEERAGRIPPAPEAIQGSQIKFDYLSPVQRAQQLSELRGMEEFTAGVMEKAQFRPELMDLVNWDEVIRASHKGHSVIARIIRPVAEVDEIRAANAAVAREQQEKEDMAAMAQGAGQAAPALKLLQGEGGA
jgi:hypothetical protein